MLMIYITDISLFFLLCFHHFNQNRYQLAHGSISNVGGKIKKEVCGFFLRNLLLSQCKMSFHPEEVFEDIKQMYVMVAP